MENDNISYSSFVKKKKSDNITPENFGEIVLTQITGISDKTAVIIMKEFIVKWYKLIVYSIKN